MDFQHNDARQMLADMLHRYFSERYDWPERIAARWSADGYSRTHWAAFGELGIVGALFPENVGGFCDDGFDIAVIFEQLGRALAPEPFLAALIAGRALGDDLTAEMLSGQQLPTPAFFEPGSPDEYDRAVTRAEPVDGGWKLNGAKALVPSLASADGILVSAKTPRGLSLFLIRGDAAGITRRCYPLVDGGQAGELELADTPGLLVGAEGAACPAIEDAIAAGTVALCWEAVGAMDALCASTLDYMRVRSQFGAPIASFQVLRHRMATVAMEIEQARSAAINATAALDKDSLVRDRAVSAAKYTIDRVSTLVAEEAVQIHGGMGMTWELPVSHYAKRLTMVGHQLGDEDHHLARFIRLSAAA